MKGNRSLRVLRSLSLTLGIAFAGLFVASCTDNTDPGVLTNLVVSPNPATVAAGGTVQFTAMGTDFTGRQQAPNPGAVVWSVQSGGGSINSSTGVFTASTTPGTYTNTILATCRGITATATVIITPGPLATITVTPNPVTLPINATQQYTAVGKDAFGNVVAITPVWSVAAGGGAISTTGLFTAGTTPGTFANTVKATSGAISGTATVTVTVGPLATITVTPNPATMAIGVQQTFTAVGKDAGGNVVPLTPVWSVVNGGGTIVSTSGVFTAGNTSGTYTNTVKATSGTISGTATVIVTVGPLATIDVTPNPATMAIGVQQTFTAVGKDAGGNVVALTPVWSVVNGGGTIVSTSGVFTAGNTPGTFTNTVKATSGTISGTATVIVTVGPLATIDVTPNPATMAIGAQQTFTAVGKDAGGNVVALTPVWSVVNGGGTIVSTSGVFTAGNTPGTFTNTVQATSGTVSGTATVIVTVGPLATIDVTPNPATMVIGAQQTFTAVGKDAGGNVVALTPVWSVVNGGGTIVSTSGVFTAGNTPGTFTNTVKATSGTISGTATVIVIAGPVATITVTPNPVTLASGTQQTFTAVGRDAGNNIVPITPVWSVVSGGGTINASTGVFTAGNTAGTFNNTVKATQGTASGTATVTVTVAAPAFRVLANSTVACTSGSITGDVGTLVAAPTGAITLTSCPIASGTAQTGTAASIAAYNNSVTTFTSTGTQPCGTVLTGTQAGAILAPGVYCFDAAATLTGVLTLNGAGTYLFKTGTSGVGGFTATNFSMVLSGGASACSVTWRSQDAATTTDSDLKGTILARQDITLTRGTLNGDAHSQGNVTISGTGLTPCTP